MNCLLYGAVPLLLEWYRISKRTLPWRGTEDPYRVLVSEVMLQQTRVEAVKDYYVRFLEKFPTANDLAAASEEEVLKSWEGLGYYTRARNLHKAAGTIAECGFPQTYEGVRKLAGVGDYTAGAICSIAFNLPCPAVDGNVLRVLTRLLGDGRNIDEPSAKAAFAEELREVYPPQASDFCQALMELGAIVCVPNGEPLCRACPWSERCVAHLSGRENEFPVRNEKKARKTVPMSVLVLEKEGMYALEKRGNKGLLAGLWQFPLFPGEADPARYGVVTERKSARHIFTHIEWNLSGYLIRAREFFPEYVWRTAEEIRSDYALPSALKAFLPWLK